MSGTLGGWSRLAIVVGALYLCAVALTAWFTVPNSEIHEYRFYALLDAADRERILNARIKLEDERAFIETAKSMPSMTSVEMPNHHTLIFMKALPKVDIEASAKGYWDEVEKAENVRRRQYLVRAGVWGIFPLLIISMMVGGALWTYRGFSSRK